MITSKIKINDFVKCRVDNFTTIGRVYEFFTYKCKLYMLIHDLNGVNLRVCISDNSIKMFLNLTNN
jgi:hypothetical protein